METGFQTRFLFCTNRIDIIISWKFFYIYSFFFAPKFSVTKQYNHLQWSSSSSRPTSSTLLSFIGNSINQIEKSHWSKKISCLYLEFGPFWTILDLVHFWMFFFSLVKHFKFSNFLFFFFPVHSIVHFFSLPLLNLVFKSHFTIYMLKSRRKIFVRRFNVATMGLEWKWLQLSPNWQ